jgi:hypothetical protein
MAISDHAMNALNSLRKTMVAYTMRYIDNEPNWCIYCHHPIAIDDYPHDCPCRPGERRGFPTPHLMGSQGAAA